MEKRSIWMRMGVTVYGTKEEIEALLGNDVNSQKTFEELIGKGNFYPNGDSYIPESCIQDYNAEYGTKHEECDYDGFDAAVDVKRKAYIIVNNKTNKVYCRVFSSENAVIKALQERDERGELRFNDCRFVERDIE